MNEMGMANLPCVLIVKMRKNREFSGGPVSGLQAFTLKAWVQSLVGEPTSCKLHGKKEKLIQKKFFNEKTLMSANGSQLISIIPGNETFTGCLPSAGHCASPLCSH